MGRYWRKWIISNIWGHRLPRREEWKGEAKRVAGTVRMLWKNGGLGVEAKMLYEGIVVLLLTSLYGAETWGLREAERRKLDVSEIECQRLL